MLTRIKKIIESKQMNASQFADEIGVQRSALSHVLSGRNNPSLDFVLKIKEAYPEINLDWLLIGRGTMLEKQQTSKSDKFALELDFSEKNEHKETHESEAEKSVKKNPPLDLPAKPVLKQNEKDVKKIVLLFNDNTFQIFDNHE